MVNSRRDDDVTHSSPMDVCPTRNVEWMAVDCLSVAGQACKGRSICPSYAVTGERGDQALSGDRNDSGRPDLAASLTPRSSAEERQMAAASPPVISRARSTIEGR